MDYGNRRDWEDGQRRRCRTAESRLSGYPGRSAVILLEALAPEKAGKKFVV
jgi:hypothetical protein